MGIGMNDEPIGTFPLRPDDLVQPEEPIDLYEFQSLPDPPDDYEFLRVRYGGITEGQQRTLKMAQMVVLMKHYFWGMRWGEPRKTAKTTRKAHSLKTLIKTLWKLFYYMQDIHRPKDWDVVLNVYRDSGPRLLRYDISPRPKPISRWFRVVPNSQTIILPAYSRPDGAPLDLSDLYLQQHMYSADSFHDPSLFEPPLPPQIPYQPLPTYEQMRANFNFEPARPLTEEEQDIYISNALTSFLREEQPVAYGTNRDGRAIPEALPRKRRRELSPAAPPLAPHLTEPVYAVQPITGWNWMPGLTPESIAPPLGEPEIGPIIPSTETVYEKRVVTEAVERLVMQLVYADLERDPKIPSRTEPIKYMIAHSFANMLDMKIGAFSTTAKVKLCPLSFNWDPNGAMFPLRGRGPVWSANSCATDCVIVAGMLMDVGCTRIDRANNRASEFTEYEKAYIEVTNAAWETFDESMSIRVRDEFLQRFMNGQQNMRLGEPIPPWALWSQVTKGFAQFRYHYIERVTPCRCQKLQPFVNSHQGSCILPGFREGDQLGVSAGTLIERCFYTNKSFACANCGDSTGITGERKIGQLPLRLVMTFDSKTILRNHTQNLKFRYIDYQNNKQVAHYRWIGGVYNNEQHARVYWNDSKRGEQSDNNVMMYDSELNKGVMVGGIPAFKPDDRVPPEWVEEKAIPLLFYEQVLDPSRQLLATAHDTMYDMGNLIGRNKSILEAHVPWNLSNNEPDPEPWDRVLSTTGERFNDFNPTWFINTQNTPPQQPGTADIPNVNPYHIDPSVVDQSLLDPSLYSTSVAPAFDISSLLDPNAFGEEYIEDETQPRAEDRFKNHMFSSMMETPEFLSKEDKLWPSGPPGPEGALEFPDLPTWPSPKGRKHRLRTSASDTSMPDAEISPFERKVSFSHGLQTAVMLNNNLDPNIRVAKETREKERNHKEYISQKADKYTEEWKRRSDETAKQRKERERQERERMEQEAREKETPEERQLRKNRERLERQQHRTAEQDKKRLSNQQKLDTQNTDSRPTTPANPAPTVTRPPYSRAPSSVLSRTKNEDPKALRKSEHVPASGASAFTDAEQRKQDVLAKREATKSTPASKRKRIKEQRTKDKGEERGRKRAKRDDDPTWHPHGEDSD
jgi:hypothetical protein